MGEQHNNAQARLQGLRLSPEMVRVTMVMSQAAWAIMQVMVGLGGVDEYLNTPIKRAVHRAKVETATPGSDVARELGCRCPPMDISYGRGYPAAGSGQYVVTDGCPLHTSGEPRDNAESSADLASPSTLQDLLLLVDVDVPIGGIVGWTDDQMRAAEKWAGRVHLSASDNPVRVPPMPEFLRPFCKEHHGTPEVEQGNDT